MFTINDVVIQQQNTILWTEENVNIYFDIWFFHHNFCPEEVRATPEKLLTVLGPKPNLTKL